MESTLRPPHEVLGKVWVNHVLDMAELPAFVTLKLSSGSRSSDTCDMLFSLCCNVGSHNATGEFQEAWRKLEVLAQSRNVPVLRGIRIPVRVQMNAFGTSRQEVLRWIRGVIRDRIDSQNVCWGGATPRSRRDCYSSFLLDSISLPEEYAPFGHLYDGKKFMGLIEEISGYVQFSHLFLRPSNDSKAQATSESTCRAILDLLSRNNNCSNAIEKTRCATNDIHVHFPESFLWELKVVCAALAVTQSCRSVCFENFWSKDSACAIMWQCLAFALFSKRARTRSSMKKIKLIDVYLSLEDAEAIAKEVAKDIPAPNRQNQDEGEYHVNEGTIVQVTTNFGHGVETVESSEVLRGKQVCGVTIVGNDDGKTEWVDAIVPGVGLCKLPRCSLTQCNHVKTFRPEPEVVLNLEFSSSRRAAEGLRRLVELVGTSLQSLRLTLKDFDSISSVLDPTWIISSCPHLQELTVRNRELSSESFVKACMEKQVRLRHLDAKFDDLRVVVHALRDATYSLSISLQWWHCPLVLYDQVRPLKKIPRSNRSLEYLTIKAEENYYETIHDKLSRFDGEEPEVKKKLPIDVKLAFLSGFNSNEPRPFRKQTRGLKVLQSLNCDVISTIFEFTEVPAVRKVKIVHESAPGRLT